MTHLPKTAFCAYRAMSLAILVMARPHSECLNDLLFHEDLIVHMPMNIGTARTGSGQIPTGFWQADEFWRRSALRVASNDSAFPFNQQDTHY